MWATMAIGMSAIAATVHPSPNQRHQTRRRPGSSGQLHEPPVWAHSGYP
jgi:hypothetical protein